MPSLFLDSIVEMRGIEPRSEEKTTRTFTSIVRSVQVCLQIPERTQSLQAISVKFHLMTLRMSSSYPNLSDTLL